MPATTGSGESDFVIDRSVSVFSVVVSVAELLSGVGSDVVALTVAVFDRSVVLDEFTVTVSVRDVLAPFAKPPIAHVTVPAESVPPPDAEHHLVEHVLDWGQPLAGRDFADVRVVQSTAGSFQVHERA